MQPSAHEREHQLEQTGDNSSASSSHAHPRGCDLICSVSLRLDQNRDIHQFAILFDLYFCCSIDLLDVVKGRSRIALEMAN